MTDNSSLLDSVEPTKEEKSKDSQEAKLQKPEEKPEKQEEKPKEAKLKEAKSEKKEEAKSEEPKPEKKDDDLDLPEIKIDSSLDVEGLRALRQEAMRQKRMLIEKKGALSTKIREEVDTTQELKTERDALNQKVKAAKAEREKFTGKIRELSKKLKELETKLDGFKGTRPLKAIKEELEKAEWAYQTQSLSPSKSHDVWKSIEDLTDSLKASKAKDEVFTQFRNVRREIDSLKNEQSKYHHQVLKHAKESELKHKMLSDIYARIDEVRDKRKLINKKLQIPIDKLKAIDAEIKKHKSELHEEKERTRKYQESTNHKLLSAKAKEVEARFKKTGKLTKEDLLIIQEAELEL